MRIQLLYLTIFLLSCSFTHLHGQTLKQYEKKAEEAYAEHNYSGALAYYKVILDIDPNRIDALFYGGESSRQMRVFPLAESMLERIPDTSKTGAYFLTDFNLASVKKGLKKYDEAIVYYQKFIGNKSGLDDILLKRATEELKYCEWALNHLDNAAPFNILHYDTTINTYLTDFAPLKIGDALFYTSGWKEKGSDEYAKTVSRIFCSIGEEQGVPIPENATEKDKHTAHIAFSSNGERMYYTICEEEQGLINEFKCKIYYRNQTLKGGWSNPYLLPASINLPGYTATQPAIGWDMEKEQEILYFSSNRPGSIGGMDIWYSIINDTIYATPTIVDSVNTAFDDITPYFHQESNSLYFSSNGHQSLGGLDIFRSTKTAYGWSPPENVGYPINSSYDDLYYSFNSELAQGHFASNRPEAMCDDPYKECTCDDIFYFNMEVTLDILTFNEINNYDLEGVKVELKNLTDNIIDTFIINEVSNDFHFPLVLEKDYQITATKKQYRGATTEVSTKGIIYPTVLKESLYLRPNIDLVVLTYDAISKLPLNETSIRLTRETLDTDTSLVNAFDSNQCSFSLDFEQEYTITAAKQNYSSDFDSFSTVGYYTPTVITKELYLTPFQGLPLTLYFDNARPRYINREDTTTQLTYAQTYERYYSRKGVFLNGFSAGLSGFEREIARDTVGNFFDNEVKQGYEDLMKFSEILADYLKRGNRIEIIVEGYASPLAASDYNKKLTGRRVSSVINQFRTFQGGVLAQYIDSENLVIKEAPKGEDDAPDGVDDSPGNRRESVFGPKASRQRRVKILDIRRQEDIFSYTKK